jgi:hypothetical protein
MKVDMISATGTDITFKDTANMKTVKGEDGVKFAYFK